jgi:GNAT superfamily N-acetyltransferase
MDRHRLSHFSSGGDALYRGQWDGWIVAYDKTGRQIGRLDWQSWGQPGADEPSFRIKLIEVLPEYRRRGVATALYRELFRQEGITERDLAPATQSPEGAAFRRGARLGPPQFVLTRNGREVMRGSEDQIWTWLHRHHSFSVDWALKYEGYAITPARSAS